MTPEHIIQAISEVTGISRDEIMGRSRPRKITTARGLIWKMCRVALDMNEHQTCVYFKRTNTNIHYGIERAEYFMSKHPGIKAQYDKAWDLAWSMALERAA